MSPLGPGTVYSRYSAVVVLDRSTAQTLATATFEGVGRMGFELSNCRAITRAAPVMQYRMDPAATGTRVRGGACNCGGGLHTAPLARHPPRPQKKAQLTGPPKILPRLTPGPRR